MVFGFSKDVTVNIVLKHSSVYVRANTDNSPKSVIEGTLIVNLKKKIPISNISVSLSRRIIAITETIMEATEPTYTDKAQIASQTIFSYQDNTNINNSHNNNHSHSHNTATGLSPNSNSNYSTSTSSDLGLVLPPGKYSYDFCLWAPDNLEPTIKTDRLDIKYLLKAKVTCKKQQTLFNMSMSSSNTAKSEIPVDVFTLPRFLHTEQLDDSLNSPFFWNINNDENADVILSLPSKILVNSSSNPTVTMLMVDDIISNEKKKLVVKSITIALHQETSYGPPNAAKFHKRIVQLFVKSVKFTNGIIGRNDGGSSSSDSDTDSSASSTSSRSRRRNRNTPTTSSNENTIITTPDPDQQLLSDTKQYLDLTNKRYYNITLPYITSESFPSIALSKFNTRHFLRATIHFESQIDKSRKIVSSYSPILFITSATERFIDTLPTYPDHPNDSLIIDCSHLSSAPSSIPSPPYILTQ